MVGYGREDDTSINQSVVMAVAEKRSAMKTAEFFAERGSGADPKAALARKNHRLPAAAAHPLAVAGRTPASRFDRAHAPVSS